MRTIMLAQEIETRPLTIEELQARIPEIERFLLDWGYDRVNATFGYGSKLPMNKLWIPTEIDTSSIGAFVESAVRKGIFEVGHSDLHIEDRQETLEFRLCHESDIHFESSNQGFVEKVITLWRGRGLGLRVSTAPKGSALPKVWTPIDPGSGDSRN
jgi:hypothetical protein